MTVCKTLTFIFKFCLIFFNGPNVLFSYTAGEWHQYDDIICSEPPKRWFEKFREYMFSEQMKKVIKGREIAGSFMLIRIFTLLENWNKMNVRKFFCQLQQFFEVYGNPFVFEKTSVKWSSLKYNEKDVSEPYVSQHIMKNIILKYSPKNHQQFKF